MTQATHFLDHAHGSTETAQPKPEIAYKEPESTSRGFLFMTFGVVILSWVAALAVAYVSR